MGRLDDMRAAAKVGSKPAAAPSVKPVSPVAKPEPLSEKSKKPEKPLADDDAILVYSCGCRVGVRSVRDIKCRACKNRESRDVEAKRVVKRDDPNWQRLPAGSQKTCLWDGKEWSGTLTIPGVSESFWYVAPNETMCFRGLHAEYMKWLQSQPTPSAPPSEGV